MTVNTALQLNAGALGGTGFTPRQRLVLRQMAQEVGSWWRYFYTKLNADAGVSGFVDRPFVRDETKPTANRDAFCEFIDLTGKDTETAAHGLNITSALNPAFSGQQRAFVARAFKCLVLLTENWALKLNVDGGVTDTDYLGLSGRGHVRLLVGAGKDASAEDIFAWIPWVNHIFSLDEARTMTRYWTEVIEWTDVQKALFNAHANIVATDFQSLADYMKPV